MPKRTHKNECKQCGVIGTDELPISTRGLCVQCGLGNHVQSCMDINSRRGVYYQRWREGMRRAADAADAELGEPDRGETGTPSATASTAA